MTRVEIRPRPGGVPDDLGRPALPGSKSHAQRAMLLAAGTSTGVLLRGAPRSDDVVVLGRALAELGVELAWRDADLWVGGGLWRGVRGTVHLGENGTALRTLPAVVAMLEGELSIDGAPGLARRPLGPLFALLAQAGVRVVGDRLPVNVDGRGARWPEHLVVDGRLTTQVATGAILGLALRARAGLGGGVVEVQAPGAVGYVEITTRMLDLFGHAVEIENRRGDLRVRVSDAVREAPEVYEVPGDPSAGTVPMALAILHGLARGGDRLVGEPAGDPHPDHFATADFERLREADAGARVVFDHLATRPDAFPALCAVAAARDGETELRGAPALRQKESDRIAAMASGLRAAGATCRELEDGLIVRGPLPAREGVAELAAPADHRVVMSLALLGTVLPDGVALEHAEATAKSWPGFFDWLGRVADVRYGGNTIW